MEQPSEFTLCLPGDPVPKGRPRVYNGHAMTPKRTVRAEERLFAEFRLKYPQAKPYQCPVRLEAEFWMSHRGRPDLDNLLKLVLDSLNGVAYVDDAQVVESHASKRMPDLWVYGSKGRYRTRVAGMSTSRTSISVSNRSRNGSRRKGDNHEAAEDDTGDVDR